MHGVGHHIFGATLEGNAWVELLSHLGFTLNVLVTGMLTILMKEGSPRLWYSPKYYEIIVAIAIAVLAFLFSFVWVPCNPYPADFDYPDGIAFNKTLVTLLQARVQQLIEATLIITTVLYLFLLRRIWNCMEQEDTSPLEWTTCRISISCCSFSFLSELDSLPMS